MSLREEILKKTDLAREIVEVPAWGMKLAVQSMTGLERARVLRQTFDEKGNLKSETGLIGPVLVMCVRDPETGERVFQDGDVDQIMAKNAEPLQALYNVAARLSGLGGEQSLKQAEKNFSGTTASDGSPTT